MAWEVLWEKGGVRLRCHGALTEADIVEGIDAMQQDPRFDTLRWNINDFSEVHNLADLPGYIEDATARAIGGAYTNRGQELWRWMMWSAHVWKDSS